MSSSLPISAPLFEVEALGDEHPLSATPSPETLVYDDRTGKLTVINNRDALARQPNPEDYLNLSEICISGHHPHAGNQSAEVRSWVLVKTLLQAHPKLAIDISDNNLGLTGSRVVGKIARHARDPTVIRLAKNNLQANTESAFKYLLRKKAGSIFILDISENPGLGSVTVDTILHRLVPTENHFVALYLLDLYQIGATDANVSNLVEVITHSWSNLRRLAIDDNHWSVHALINIFEGINRSKITHFSAMMPAWESPPTDEQELTDYNNQQACLANNKNLCHLNISNVDLDLFLPHLGASNSALKLLNIHHAKSSPATKLHLGKMLGQIVSGFSLFLSGDMGSAENWVLGDSESDIVLWEKLVNGPLVALECDVLVKPALSLYVDPVDPANSGSAKLSEKFCSTFILGQKEGRTVYTQVATTEVATTSGATLTSRTSDRSLGSAFRSITSRVIAPAMPSVYSSSTAAPAVATSVAATPAVAASVAAPLTVVAPAAAAANEERLDLRSTPDTPEQDFPGDSDGSVFTESDTDPDATDPGDNTDTKEKKRKNRERKKKNRQRVLPPNMYMVMAAPDSCISYCNGITESRRARPSRAGSPNTRTHSALLVLNFAALKDFLPLFAESLTERVPHTSTLNAPTKPVGSSIKMPNASPWVFINQSDAKAIKRITDLTSEIEPDNKRSMGARTTPEGSPIKMANPSPWVVVDKSYEIREATKADPSSVIERGAKLAMRDPFQFEGHDPSSDSGYVSVKQSVIPHPAGTPATAIAPPTVPSFWEGKQKLLVGEPSSKPILLPSPIIYGQRPIQEFQYKDRKIKVEAREPMLERGPEYFVIEENIKELYFKDKLKKPNSNARLEYYRPNGERIHLLDDSKFPTQLASRRIPLVPGEIIRVRKVSKTSTTPATESLMAGLSSVSLAK